MRSFCALPILLIIPIGLTTDAFAQGRRGAATPQQAGAPANTGGRGAAGGGRGAGGSATGFFNFDTTATAGMPISGAPPIETHQKITVNGQPLAYTAKAGFLPLQNATTGQTEAHLFLTAYSRDGVTDATTRPIVFFAGGAPGVAASWQEFGGFGPKRVKLPDSGNVPVGGAVENPGTLLNQADLVFVNPVGTAYSRPSTPAAAPEFWNTAADTAALGEFVRSFLNRTGRRGSPVFLGDTVRGFLSRLS